MPDEKINFDTSDPLRRTGRETAKASRALRDYALMGPGRSLRKLAEQYQGQEKVPTKRRPTLEGWSARFSWQDRVALFDLAEFEADLARYYDDREKWRARRDSLLEMTWAKISTAVVMLQPASLFDEGGGLRGSLAELIGAVKTISNESRIEHEQLPDFARGGSSQLSAAVNALISRELVRLARAGADHLVDVPAEDTDG